MMAMAGMIAGVDGIVPGLTRTVKNPRDGGRAALQANDEPARSSMEFLVLDKLPLLRPDGDAFAYHNPGIVLGKKFRMIRKERSS
jgi:hypothetical protein